MRSLFGIPLPERKGMKTGGQAVPRKTVIANQPHQLAYINPREEQMLLDAGGTGQPGPGGIPAFADYGDSKGFNYRGRGSQGSTTGRLTAKEASRDSSAGVTAKERKERKRQLEKNRKPTQAAVKARDKQYALDQGYDPLLTSKQNNDLGTRSRFIGDPKSAAGVSTPAGNARYTEAARRAKEAKYSSDSKFRPTSDGLFGGTSKFGNQNAAEVAKNVAVSTPYNFDVAVGPQNAGTGFERVVGPDGKTTLSVRDDSGRDSYSSLKRYEGLPYLRDNKTPGFREELALGSGSLLAGIMNALTGGEDNAFKKAYIKQYGDPDGDPIPEEMLDLALKNFKSRTQITKDAQEASDAQAVVDRKEAREGDARDPVTGQRIRDLDFECPEGYTFNEAEQRCEIIASAVAGAGAGIPTPPGGGFPDLTNAGVTTGVPVVNNQYTQFAAPTLAGLPAAATNGFVMPMMNTQPITIAQQTPQGLAGLQQQIQRNAGMQTG